MRFAAPKGILVQLRQLLVEYQRQQSLVELATRFSELANRQNANLRETVALAKMAPTDQPITDEGQRTALELQRAEQVVAQGRNRTVLTKLAAVAEESAGMTRRSRRASVATRHRGQCRRVPRRRHRRSRRGTVAQRRATKSARDRLREIGRLLGAPKTRTPRCGRRSRRSRRPTASRPSSLNKPNRSASTAPRPPRPTTRQADLVDETDQLRKSVDALADAARDLKKAGDDMQKARHGTRRRRSVESVPRATRRDARPRRSPDKIESQLAKTASARQPEDKLATLKKLEENCGTERTRPAPASHRDGET
jgi:hypothetical protein